MNLTFIFIFYLFDSHVVAIFKFGKVMPLLSISKTGKKKYLKKRKKSSMNYESFMQSLKYITCTG